MVPITIEEFTKQFLKENKGINESELKANLAAAVKRKKSGAGCIQCDQPIWSVGSALAGTDMCFTCMTGETNHSDDLEIEEVC